MTLKIQSINTQKLRRAFTVAFTQEAFILLIYMAISASVLNIFMQTRSLKESSEEFGFSKMLDGSAIRPNVYRQLVPIIANQVARIVPPQEQQFFESNYLNRYHLKEMYFGKARERLEWGFKLYEEWSPEYAIKYHAVYILIFFTLVATLYSLRALIPTVSSNYNPLTPFVPVLFVLLMPMFFMHGNFSYDFLELLFLSLLMLSAKKGNYAWWLILFPLAVLNKETNILALLLYSPIIIGNCFRWRSRLFLSISFTISLSIYFFIKHKYSQNIGDSFSWYPEDKIVFLLDPKSYFLWWDLYAPMIPFPRGFNIILLLILAKLLFWQWHDKPVFIKRLLIIAAVVNFPLFMLFCQKDEIRNLSFMFMPMYLLAVHTLLSPEMELDKLKQIKP